MWPKNCSATGGTGTFPSKSRVRGVWLKASRRRERLNVGSRAALSPPPTKTETLRAARSLPLPVQPPRHACELLWAGGIYEVRGEPPTQRLLVPLSSGTRSLGAGHRTQAGKAPPVPQSPPPRVPDPHPQPSLSIERPSPLHGFMVGLPSTATTRTPKSRHKS